MQSKRLVPALISLLWFIALNHCLVDSLFHSERAHADCPYHAAGDSSSHREGEPCAIKQISTQRINVELPTVLTATNFFNSMPPAADIPVPLSLFTLDLTQVIPKGEIKRSFTALAIASNAPPTAA